MRQRIYIWIAIAIVLLLLFGSCRSIKYVPVETVRTDSLYLTVHERDSIHIKDFIYIREKGDTVFVERWRTQYRDRGRTDTLYVDRVREVQVPYPVEKELTWWQKTKIELGELSIGIILVLLIVVIWLIKKKGGAR
ncbi:MAG: hypothetical protein BHV79_06410 [Bacteroides uniformis]|uniref:Uncharacterized protein n=1 Tax=Bacteroides uniformis TaxID=820 RepID=A0A1Q6I9G1_BACUN|nr:MAG: hypothetical protein BHV79_06410 [Bacteroides uniformis]